MLFYIFIYVLRNTSRNPQIFSVNMGQFLETIDDKIPSFVGIKFTSNDLEEGARALRANNEKYVVFLGNDQVKCTIDTLMTNVFFSGAMCLTSVPHTFTHVLIFIFS